jgi:2-hydroxycyclohexanecarboxyl-CoA dehydrogenase
MQIRDRTAIVTGGASGIGRATVLTLARAGARVFVGDVDEAGAAETCERAASSGGGVEASALDVTDEGSVARFLAEVERAVSRVDILVNAAGWDRAEPFLDNPPGFWERIVDLNFMGPLRMMRGVLPGMIGVGGGKIVNVASDAGRVGSSGEAVYSGAKGGVIAVTKAIAREMARHRINVNCVCPGPTDTPLFASQPQKIREGLLRAIPFRRLARPEEIADAVLFFASSCSDYVTGQILSVSGGLTMVD